MKISKNLIRLCWLIALLALIYAGLGLFWQTAGSPATFTTLRGESVEIAGNGLYRYDTVFFSAGFRGNDAVTILLELPLLVLAILLYRRGSLRGGFLLAGSLAYFLYNSFSLGTSAAYNPLFLLYVGTFTASLFACGILWAQFDFTALQTRVLPRMPRRGAAIYLIFAGAATALLWLSDILPQLAQGLATGDVRSLYHLDHLLRGPGGHHPGLLPGGGLAAAQRAARLPAGLHLAVSAGVDGLHRPWANHIPAQCRDSLQYRSAHRHDRLVAGDGQHRYRLCDPVAAQFVRGARPAVA